jgi:large subunit ribosomal protein L14
MKSLKAKVPKSLVTGSALDCVDNTGARTLQIIAVRGYRGVKKRQPKAGIGEIVIVSVKKGTPEMRRQVLNAVIIRQKQEFRRQDGIRVRFEDNAAVITDDKGDPRGTEIKGPVAREVAERFGKIASVAQIIA